MKGILIAISGMIVMMSATVYGQSDTPVTDLQQMHQENWIDRSFDRGQLDRREAPRPDREPDRLDRRENRTKVDEAVTTKRAARTGAAKHRAPRQMLRKPQARHGAQHR
ncbi:MAG: hypothetical protein OEV01_04055 [Nitrospira sp.]|nr:hypothetical protein [Nitrospira sp.]MDH4303057.1 hypothetical protein [Nitrospira sp.]MDH5192646.1 hypothetical protein [Nitrospira sp.]